LIEIVNLNRLLVKILIHFLRGHYVTDGALL
jgi:hypothetical protein